MAFGLWVFATTPNSASCERVFFFLLRVMYGEQQARVLSDHLQISLMSWYNAEGWKDCGLIVIVDKQLSLIKTIER